MKNIKYSSVVWQEGEHFVAQCLNVEVSSFGDNQGTIIKFWLKVGVAALLIPIKKISERWVKDRIVHQTEVTLS